MASKEAIVLCLDVGRSMFNPATQGESRAHTKLYEAQQALSLFLQHKIADGRKTEQVGLVLFGSDETKNDLDYANVCVQFPVQMATVEMVRYIEDVAKGCNARSDWLDALVVAMDLLETHDTRMPGWKTYARRVIIVTDAADKINDEHMDVIIRQLNQQNYKLQIFGLDFTDPDYPIKTLPHKTQLQIDNEVLLHELTTKVDGMEIIPMTEALERLSWFRSRSIRQTSLFRGFLELGDALQIPVHMFTKAAEAKPKSFKKIYIENDGTPVEVMLDRTYKRVEDDEPVEKDDLVKAYKYGRTYVPFDKADEALAMTTEKCLQITGFVRSSELPLMKYLGSTSSGTVEVDSQPNDPKAAYALSALIHALYELDRVALVRYKKNNGKGGPVMGVLTPHITLKRECLFFTRIPFVEDIREYTFVSLEKSRPSAEQQRAMDDLVDSLDMMNAAKDSYGNDTEDLKPSNVPNVVIHRIQEAIKVRAIHGKTRPLPLSQPSLDKVLQRNSSLWNHAATAVEKVDSSFKLTKTENALKREAQQQWGDTKVEDVEAKRTRVEDQVMDLTKLADQAVENVGSMDPVGDFHRIINQRNVDRIATAMDQLGEIIKVLVANSFGASNFDKALEALREFRKTAIVEEESKRFNDLLLSIKTAPRTNLNNARFWEMVVRTGTTLISQTEADDSRVSTWAAGEFIQMEVAPKASLPTPASEPNNSLIDELK